MKNKFLLNPDLSISLNTTNCIKGILAVMVLISHLQARVDLFSTSILETLFSSFGYLAVSGFFFLSGYGLNEASSRKIAILLISPEKSFCPFSVYLVSL